MKRINLARFGFVRDKDSDFSDEGTFLVAIELETLKF